MTVGKKAATPEADTVVARSFSAFEQAIKAQQQVNEQADKAFNERRWTEEGCREHRESIRSSSAAKIVDDAEFAVLQRKAQADDRYQKLLAEMIQPGDTAQEQRNSRYASRIQRQLDATKSPGEKIEAARQLMRQADQSQLGVLIEELPSHFTDTSTSWIESDLRAINPQLADAAKVRQRATQAAQMASFAAEQVRQGFQNGRPPATVGKLAQAAIGRYDPDRPQ